MSLSVAKSRYIKLARLADLKVSTADRGLAVVQKRVEIRVLGY